MSTTTLDQYIKWGQARMRCPKCEGEQEIGAVQYGVFRMYVCCKCDSKAERIGGQRRHKVDERQMIIPGCK